MEAGVDTMAFTTMKDTGKQEYCLLIIKLIKPDP